MSKLEYKTTFENILALLAIIGACLIAASLIVLALGVAFDHTWFVNGLEYVFPLLMIGLIIFILSVKLLEISN